MSEPVGTIDMNIKRTRIYILNDLFTAVTMRLLKLHNNYITGMIFTLFTIIILTLIKLHKSYIFYLISS